MAPQFPTKLGNKSHQVEVKTVKYPELHEKRGEQNTRKTHLEDHLWGLYKLRYNSIYN